MSLGPPCGIILTTANVPKMVSFYRYTLGLPLQREEHGDLAVHYGIDFPGLHFAIHPVENLAEATAGPTPDAKGRDNPVTIAFQVEELESVVARLEAAGHLFDGPHDEGFGPFVRLRDPDGNLIELVELEYEFPGEFPSADEDDEG